MKAVIVEIGFKEDLPEEKCKEIISNFCENNNQIKRVNRLTYRQLKRIFNPPMRKKLSW